MTRKSIRAVAVSLLVTAVGAGTAGCEASSSEPSDGPIRFDAMVAGDAGSDASSPPSDGPIRFDGLAVGQQSRYAVLVGEEYGNPRESPFRYVDGVLLAEIVGQDDNGFRVRESFEVKVDPSDDVELSWLEPDVAYEYHLGVDEDGLVVRRDEAEHSRLFPHWVDRALPLGDIATPETDVFGWTTARPYCECYEEAYIASGKVRDTTYGRLNVVVDNEWMQVDGPGATMLYAARYGLVRSATYNWWTRRGVGFDLIAE